MTQGHSYSEQVTAEHDAHCITAALKSVCENTVDAGTFKLSISEALEQAYGYIAEGLSYCKCLFAGMPAERRIDFMAQFSDSALAAMAQGGYFNDATCELLTCSLEELQEVFNRRAERDADWVAKDAADNCVPNQNSWTAIVASDTEPQASYTLLVDGKKSEHGTFVSKWGIAYAVARELLTAGIDVESNLGIILAVLSSLEDYSSTVAGDLEFSVKFEGQ